MATTTKKTKRKAESVKVPQAAERIGVSRHVIYEMVELGYFTAVRMNPLRDQSNRRIFTDEIDRYLELAEQGLPRDRVLAGMKQFRIEAGRLKVS